MKKILTICAVIIAIIGVIYSIISKTHNTALIMEIAPLQSRNNELEKQVEILKSDIEKLTTENNRIKENNIDSRTKETVIQQCNNQINQYQIANERYRNSYKIAMYLDGLQKKKYEVDLRLSAGHDKFGAIFTVAADSPETVTHLRIQQAQYQEQILAASKCATQ